MKRNGFFISIEGIDGSGKSSIIKVLKEKLKKYIQNNELPFSDIVDTREPGGNFDLCEKIREIILSNNLDYKTELLLIVANRIEHLRHFIIPQLNQNKLVLTDRFIDSSLVYQGIAKLKNWKAVLKLNKWCFNKMPDITFILDLDPNIALDRIDKDLERKKNRFDIETIEKHNEIRKGFKFIAKKFPKRIVLVDATKTINQITEEIINKILCITK